MLTANTDGDPHPSTPLLTEPSTSLIVLEEPSASHIVLSTTPPDDPPPPYPSPRRPRQNRRRRPQDTHHSHTQAPSDEYDPALTHHLSSSDGPDDHDLEAVAPTESTPLLSTLARNPLGSSSPRPPSVLPPVALRRPRTLSLTSTLRSSTSLAPSFAHTVFSAFHPERDSDLDPDCREPTVDDSVHPDSEPELDSPILRPYSDQQRALAADLSGHSHRHPQRPHPQQRFFAQRCTRYFRPLWRRAYYSAVFHLVVLNFPYALAAWLFTFVFTLVGTCTLMALPLGAVFCFADLFGARLLARGELALQTTYHGPLAYPMPHPPLPIFTRMRAPTPSQIEAGVSANALVPETSFYKNTYAMFTDPTSYQPLFYFLVIKPAITVLMFLFFLVVVPVAAVCVVPLPAVLRLARRMGIWQANVAVDGLYFAAR